MKVIIIGFLLAFASCSMDHLRVINHNDFISEINKVATTWTAGVNERFADMTVEEAKMLLGAKPTPADKRLPLKMNFSQDATSSLPENFDLRTAYPQCESLREIRDQSTCGSCWAFGAAEAMSDRICVASAGKLQTRVSTENLLSCCSSCGDGCNGGYPSAAWQYWKSSGLPTGGLHADNTTCQPYSFAPCDHHVTGKYGPCSAEEFPTPECNRSSCSAGYPRTFKQDLWYGSSAYSLGSEEEIQADIFAHGSVEAAFTVYADFLNYKSGVYQTTSWSALGGHAIKVIGWGVENGTKYWLCVNSWNEGWGDAGTFKILRGEDHCGIESEMVAGLPRLNTQNLH